MGKQDKIFFQLQKIVILGYVLAYHIPFLYFLLILIIEYILQTLTNVIRMHGTRTGNSVALENDKKNYRFNVKYDYLYYNFYIILIMFVPVVYSIFALGLGENSFESQIKTLVRQDIQFVFLVLLLLCMQIIQTAVYFSSGKHKSAFIEELAHFDFVRIFIFSLIMMFSGPIAWSLELSDNVFQLPLIVMMIVGDSLLNLFFNKEKETVIF